MVVKERYVEDITSEYESEDGNCFNSNKERRRIQGYLNRR